MVYEEVQPTLLPPPSLLTLQAPGGLWLMTVTCPEELQRALGASLGLAVILFYVRQRMTGSTGLTRCVFFPYSFVLATSGDQKREANHETSVRQIPAGQADPVQSLHHPRHCKLLHLKSPPTFLLFLFLFLPPSAAVWSFLLLFDSRAATISTLSKRLLTLNPRSRWL